MLFSQQIREFQELVHNYYDQHGRHEMLWRQPETDGSFDPYKIMVSEIMLQQTQVARVTQKYQEFLSKFPDIHSLAAAPLAEILAAWNGLGYNRRAKYLWQAAQGIERKFSSHFPAEFTDLVSLPGIGPNTAGAILTYAFSKPVIFIETNIRTVYIHHFFADKTEVIDKDLRGIIEQTLDTENPREWYWALMDYGAYLKQTVGNLSKWSKSYAKQSKFEGSKRQIRGEILRQLIKQPRTRAQLNRIIPDKRLDAVLAELISEEMVKLAGSSYQLG